MKPEDAAEGAPLLVFLHGRDGNEDSGLVDEMFAALGDLGDRAPIIAFPCGGEASYWHDRGRRLGQVCARPRWDEYLRFYARALAAC